MTLQEKIRKRLIRTPIKALNRHFNYSYIFSAPTREEKNEMEAKVATALKKKNGKGG